MEYLWCFIAAAAAGIGTALAGLSAATIMVPIMIVLCPSFSGENGVYHATAIALASDILGSAVTSAIYIKHKNIDIKRARVLMICVWCMCILGSFVAFKAGSTVLGGFSLFLCLGIGIRFLTNPESKTKESKVTDSSKKRDIAISIFFGLTIGFGTGFVGTGGGMMMLLVFTAFLGMEHKKAVGTSTFIMTFTALVGFISHARIDTTIIANDYKLLLFCVASETVVSIVFAKFANKANNKVVGLTTGAVITILAIVLIFINYFC